MKIGMLLENISLCCMITTSEVLLHDGAAYGIASGFGVGTTPLAENDFVLLAVLHSITSRCSNHNQRGWQYAADSAQEA